MAGGHNILNVTGTKFVAGSSQRPPYIIVAVGHNILEVTGTQFAAGSRRIFLWPKTTRLVSGISSVPRRLGHMVTIT